MENSKNMSYNMKIFPIYKGLSWDALFYYAIEFLFLTSIKGLSAAQVLFVDAFYPIFKFILEVTPSVEEIINAKIISKSAILSPMGKLTCNLLDKKQLFREIKSSLLEHLFHREWATHQNLIQSYNKLQSNFDSLSKEKDLAKNKIKELEHQIKKLQSLIDKQKD